MFFSYLDIHFLRETIMKRGGCDLDVVYYSPRSTILFGCGSSYFKLYIHIYICYRQVLLFLSWYRNILFYCSSERTIYIFYVIHHIDMCGVFVSLMLTHCYLIRKQSGQSETEIFQLYTLDNMKPSSFSIFQYYRYTHIYSYLLCLVVLYCKAAMFSDENFTILAGYYYL